MAVRPTPPARIVVEQSGGTVCVLIEAIVTLMSEGVPPAGPSVEQTEAARQFNAQLAQRRENIMGLPSLRGIGC